MYNKKYYIQLNNIKMTHEFKKTEFDYNIEESIYGKIAKRKKSNDIIKIIKYLIIVLIISFVFSYISYTKFKNKILFANDTIIKIESKDNFSNLGTKIPELNTIWYKLYIRNNPPEYNLSEGSYKINSDSSIEGVIKGLRYPITNEVNITILEGWNIFDIDKCLSDPNYFGYTKDGVYYSCIFQSNSGDKIYIDTPLIKDGEYIEYVTNREKIIALSEFFPFLDKQITLEGFLYPDTYKVDSNNFKINSFVIKQLENFEKKVFEPLLSKYDSETITDIVNLASIVEKEERNSKEKSTVAGILKKRLNSDWMIGADVTVCYPHNLTSNECKLVISKYINEKSDYNTRTMKGLPKTPIGNPTYETIEATLNDKKTEYWYYLHNVSTGQIYYGKNNAEHEANKAHMY